MDTADILKEIVEAKRKEVERLKVEVPLTRLNSLIDTQEPALNLSGALMGDSVRIIAEVKRASPTRGMLREELDPAGLASSYADNGAAAISVLTNARHFQGSIQDMEAACAVAHPRGIPVLQKEFIFDPYQVREARAHGADAVLLIVGVLTPQRLRELIDLAGRFWMQCLVEVHDEEELRVALDAGAEIVGINNRDLRSFRTDLEVTERLARLVPGDKIVVSESGISRREDVVRVGNAGAHAVLVGEALVTAQDPGAKLRELL
jgi:indole-3-glycerol phosphate synthase